MKICENCKDVISRPLCIGCLEMEIEFWMSKRIPELIPEIRELLVSMVDFNKKGRKCVACEGKTTVCSSCYLKSVYEILKEKDVELSNQFKFLFFDLENRVMLQN